MEVVIECFPFHFQVPFHTITIVLKCCIGQGFKTPLI